MGRSMQKNMQLARSSLGSCLYLIFYAFLHLPLSLRTKSTTGIIPWLAFIWFRHRKKYNHHHHNNPNYYYCHYHNHNHNHNNDKIYFFQWKSSTNNLLADNIYKWFTSCLQSLRQSSKWVRFNAEGEQRGAKVGWGGTTDNLLIDKMVTQDCHRD